MQSGTAGHGGMTVGMSGSGICNGSMITMIDNVHWGDSWQCLDLAMVIGIGNVHASCIKDTAVAAMINHSSGYIA